jgi:hypothetical protein
MLTMRPWQIRWRMPVSDPMTSKCFWELEPDVEKGVGFLLYTITAAFVLAVVVGSFAAVILGGYGIAQLIVSAL